MSTSCLPPVRHLVRVGDRGAVGEDQPRSRLLLADDHALVRESLRRLVESDSSFKVVAEAATGLEVVERASQTEFDLLVLDVVMPEMSGLEAVRELNRRGIHIPVLFVTSSDREDHLFEALALGALGFVHKSAGGTDFLRACHRVLDGQSILLYPGTVEVLAREQQVGRSDAGVDLTPRELQLVRLVVNGHTSREIAEVMFLSPKTIERHRAQLLEKLGLRDLLELCRYAIRVGLIEP